MKVLKSILWISLALAVTLPWVNAGGEGLKKHAQARMAIEQLYQDVLGRQADQQGIETYMKMLENGMPLKQVRKALAYSPEAQKAITERFQTLVRRPPLPEEIQKSQEFLAADGTIDQLDRKILKRAAKR